MEDDHTNSIYEEYPTMSSLDDRLQYLLYDHDDKIMDVHQEIRKSSNAFSSHVISFENSKPARPSYEFEPGSFSTYEQGVNVMVKKIESTKKYPSREEHVLAERKRREKLNHRFRALSATIPGLNKKDKVTVLEDAIKYIKQLEEHVAMLEQKTLQKTVESVVFAKRSSISTNEQDDQTLALPEIEARASGNDILIRIHCEKREAMCMSDIVAEVEKLKLTVVSSNVFALGSSTIDVTIVAQMDFEFSMKVKDLVKTLREALLSYPIRNPL